MVAMWRDSQGVEEIMLDYFIWIVYKYFAMKIGKIQC